MKKHILLVVAALVMGVLPSTAKEKEKVPRGFDPLSELKEAQTKAASDKKLVVLMVKGMNDDCPNCAAAMENGLKAVGSGVVKLFARAETIGAADASEFPAALKERVSRGFVSGAAVTFVVFDPEMSKIIVEAGRKELESDKKAISEFKKTVQKAKKEYK
jgi:hypothetical protein